MGRYIIQRLLLFVPTLVMVSMILFTLLRIVPGDAIDALLAQDNLSSGMAGEVRQKIKAELGLNRPLYVQYLDWLGGALRFDFGTSLWEKRANISIIRRGFGNTLELALLGLTVAVTWGVTLGVISAVKQDTWVDSIIRIIAVGGIALPSFFVAVMLFFFLIKWFNWVPPLEYTTLFENPLSHLQQVVAPVLVLGYAGGAAITRLTRSQFLEVMREDYIRTAKAKGLRQSVISVRHALRNSLLPVVTAAALLMSGLLGGVVIVEQVFSFPGMGTILIGSINSRDYTLTLAVIWVFALIVMLTNLLVDVAYGWIDPRIRYA